MPPVIQYNESTGSDTQASGAGPATAVFGTDADGTGAGTTITLNGTFDFTGAADDGESDAIRCATAAGDRHIFSIATFTGGVATCTAIETNETIDATFSAQAWGVGGLRETLQADTTNRDWFDSVHVGRFSLRMGRTMLVRRSRTTAKVTIPLVR